jgi:glutamate--cysteine ligase
MDIDPFEPIGISLETARFLDAYLLACALDESPFLPEDAYAESNANFGLVTKEGRRPGLTLARDGQDVPLRDWAEELFEKIGRAAATLDAARGGDEHMRSFAAQRAKLDDPSLTPSARVLQTMRDAKQSFLQFALAQSERHAAQFLAHPLDAATTAQFEALARDSLDEQAQLERNEVGSFDAFVAAYRAYTLNRFSV